MDDWSQIFRLLGALAFVIALMGMLGLVLKKFGMPGMPEVPAKKRRLKIIESQPLDARRRLVLLQCDDKQHLVILGPSGETVVKNDIVPVATDEKI